MEAKIRSNAAKMTQAKGRKTKEAAMRDAKDEKTRMATDKAYREAMSYKKGGMVFKPCAGCPSPAKCRAAGKCAKGK
jgi:hypothetical protein